MLFWNRSLPVLEVEVTVAVSFAAVGIGLVFVAVIVAVAVGYVVHMWLLAQQVARTQGERRLALAASCQAASQAPVENAPQPAVPVLDLVTVARLRAAEARPERRTSRAADRKPAVAASPGR